MSRLLPSLLGIGSHPADDADRRLRKVLVLTAVLLVTPAAVLWGAIYWVFGATDAALVPWAYVVIALVSIPAFAVTRRYEWFATTHFTVFLVLPFLLMWTLGGFVPGSMVALWAWLSPLAARAIGHRRAAALLLMAFSLGIAISALLQPRLAAGDALSDTVVGVLFVLNVVVVAAITLVLVDASSGGREGSLASVRGIVRRYFSSDVADAILADPDRQALGGDIVEVTVLFADLGGYTTFSEQRSPREVVELLNTLFATALPAIQAQGGTPVQLPGDAVMAIFGAPRHMPDHAVRAARAALDIQRRTSELVRDRPMWPVFRIGINSGEALVGNIGSDEFRNFTAIGDAVNMAQRFQTLAEPGQVVTGPRTAALLGEAVVIDWLAEVRVKGKSEPVRPGVLRSVGSG
jgi:class 3 adenylate cyclase